MIVVAHDLGFKVTYHTCGGTLGIEDLIDRTVRKLFTTVGKNGGYICSLSDHFFETEPEKLAWFAEAARECVY